MGALVNTGLPVIPVISLLELLPMIDDVTDDVGAAVVVVAAAEVDVLLDDTDATDDDADGEEAAKLSVAVDTNGANDGGDDAVNGGDVVGPPDTVVIDEANGRGGTNTKLHRLY